MALRLVSSVNRKGSKNEYFTQRIPTDIKGRAVGLKLAIPIGAETRLLTITPKADAVRVSLKTSDPGTAKVRQAQVAGYMETVWQALRGKEPVALSHREATALAGEVYQGWADERKQHVIAVEMEHRGAPWRQVNDSTDAEPGAWQAVLERLAAVEEAEELEPTFGPILDRLLLSKGIAAIDAGSREMVLAAVLKALREAAQSRHRNADGDYSPDPRAEMFPTWPASMQSAANATGRGNGTGSPVSLKGLVEDWWREAKAAGRAVSTYESYRNTMGRFVAFLKHDDAARVTPANVVAFKDHRLSHGVSPKTVGDSDIAGLRSVFDWAVGNQKLPRNPAEGIRVTRAKTTRTRGKDFTPAEAVAILTHSLHARRGKERPKTFAAKRWVPWLCAYTGARIGEMVQLRKQDVRQEGDVWVVTITPEANTVKDKEMREVVLHSHLIDLGFADFIKASAAGYLFVSPNKKGEVRVVIFRGMRPLFEG